MNRTLSGATALIAFSVSLSACQAQPANKTLPESAASAGAGSTPSASTLPASADTTPTSATAATGAACDLLTAAVVTNVIGQKVTIESAGSTCTYRSVGDTAVFVASTLITSHADLAFATAIDPTHPNDVEKLAGLGDEALWVPADATILVRHGSRAFTLTSPGLSDPDGGKAKLTALAQTALPRL